MLEGLYGREVQLRDGKTVLANPGYFRESILYPDRKIVAGYQSIMPSFEGQVTEEELLQLISFLKGLRPGQTPQRTSSTLHRPP